MILSSERYLASIRERLDLLKIHIKTDNMNLRYDLNHAAEDFYANLLNLIYGYSLSNGNNKERNLTAVDLVDKVNRIAIQVTSDTSAEKVSETLRKYKEKSYNGKPFDEQFDRLIILIITTKESHKKAYEKLRLETIWFDPDKDIWDCNDLIASLSSSDYPLAKLREVAGFLEENISFQKSITNHETEWLNGGPGSLKESLVKKLKKALKKEQESHLSFKLMNSAAGLDRNLFPKGSLQIRSGDSQVELDIEWDTKEEWSRKEAALADFVRETWNPGKHKHITIEGEGGIGKTIALLSLASEPGIFPENVPALYVPLYRLNLERFWDRAKHDATSILDAYIKSYLGNVEECACTGLEINAFYNLCSHEKNGLPQVVLLLDGYNEVLDDLKGKVMRAVNEWANKAGVQIITTSRTSWSCGDDFLKISLRPSAEEDIRGYLERTGIRIPDPGDNLWSVINYPLMLTLYAHIENVQKRILAGLSFGILDRDILIWHPMNKAGDIIWNYLQKELARCAETIGDRTDLSIEDHAVAILHTAPYIAWRMSRKDYFSIPLLKNGKAKKEEDMSFSSLVKESLTFLNNEEEWPDQLVQIINKNDIIGINSERWKETARKPNSKETVDKIKRISEILLNEVNLFRIQEFENNNTSSSREKHEKRVQMMHQQFRDGLAAIWLCQHITAMEAPYVSENDVFTSTGDRYALPLCWRERIGRYILKFAAEIMNDKDAEKFWEAGRVYQPSDVRYAYTMLNLMSERSIRDDIHRNDFSALNFSGMDMRDISLFLYKSERSLKLKIPHISDFGRMTGARVSSRSFMTPGHKGTISSVSVSDDGKRAVSGGEDGSVRIWDLESMTCLKVLEGHREKVTSVSVNGDGKRAVSGGESGSLCIWDLESMTCVKVLEGHREEVTSVSVSGDGKRALSGGADGSVRIWDLESMTCVKVLEGHLGLVNSVSVSGDGKRAVSGGADGSVRIWDLESMTCVKVLEEHVGCVGSVSVNGDGKRAIFSGYDDSVRIWDLESMTCVKVLKADLGEVDSISVSSDGKRAVSGGDDGSVRIWDLDSMTCVKVLEGHREEVTGVSVSGDGKRAVSGGADGSVRIWDLDSMTCLKVVEADLGKVNSVSVSGDGKRAVSGGDDGSVRIWDLESMTCIKVLEGHHGKVNSVSVSGNGKRAVSGGDDGSVRIWDLESMTCIKVLEGHREWVNSVSVSGDGKRAVSGGNDGSVRIWDLDSMTCVKVLEDHHGKVNSVSVSGDGKRAISGGNDASVRIWDLDSMTCVKILEGHLGWVNSVSVSGDGKRAISGGGADGSVRIWDLESMTCETVFKLFWSCTNSVSVSADGKRAVCDDGFYNVRIWDLDSMTCVKVLVQHFINSSDYKY